MSKISLAPQNSLYPISAVMISCGDIDGIHDIITVAWAGTVCSNPPMLSISVRKERYSYNIMKKTGEFAVNIPDENLLYALDYCGSVSGKSHDKFAEVELTMEKAKEIKAPLIAECPLNIECKVRNIIPLGSHDMFIGEIVSIDADSKAVNGSKIDFGNLDLIAYVKNEYYSIGRKLNNQYFSTKNNK